MSFTYIWNLDLDQRHLQLVQNIYVKSLPENHMWLLYFSIEMKEAYRGQLIYKDKFSMLE